MRAPSIAGGVCEKNTPPEKTLGSISLKNTKLGAGEQFLLLDCTTKARVKGVYFHRHRYLGRLSRSMDAQKRSTRLWQPFEHEDRQVRSGTGRTDQEDQPGVRFLIQDYFPGTGHAKPPPQAHAGPGVRLRHPRPSASEAWPRRSWSRS